jgi:hypothetical protein
MKNLLHFNNLFYTTLLTVIFFSGMDGSLLYQRTFLESETHTTMEYLHFWFSVFGGWFVGYFLTRKMVDKYNLNYIFRVSLLIAAISIWTQYKTHHHSMERLFSQLIINNVYCSILLGLLSYSIVKIMNGKNELEYMKTQKIYSFIALILGLFYSYTLTDNRLGSGFLLSTFIYFATYLYFLKNGLDKLDYNIKLVPSVPMALTCFIILSGIAIVYLQFLENFKFLSEEAYPVMVFVLFLIFEATQHDKNMIKNSKEKKETPVNPLEKELAKLKKEEPSEPPVSLEKEEPKVKTMGIGKKK